MLVDGPERLLIELSIYSVYEDRFEQAMEILIGQVFTRVEATRHAAIGIDRSYNEIVGWI